MKSWWMKLDVVDESVKKKLKFCNHLCDKNCHSGECPSHDCKKKITARCQCNQLKKSVACTEVRQALDKQGKKMSTDANASYNILSCEEHAKENSQPLSQEKEPTASLSTQAEQISSTELQGNSFNRITSTKFVIILATFVVVILVVLWFSMKL